MYHTKPVEFTSDTQIRVQNSRSVLRWELRNKIGQPKKTLPMSIVSVESVVDTFKMSRFGIVSIDTETVSVSKSPTQIFCIGTSLGKRIILLTVHCFETDFFTQQTPELHFKKEDPRWGDLK